MEIYGVIGTALAGSALCALISRYKPEYTVAAVMSCGAVILFYILGEIDPVLKDLGYMFDMTGVPGAYTGILLKALGISCVSGFAADACRDSGQSGIASKVELAGKGAILVVSMPLFRALLELAGKIMNS